MYQMILVVWLAVQYIKNVQYLNVVIYLPGSYRKSTVNIKAFLK